MATLPRGIPKAPFSENVTDYFTGNIPDGSGSLSSSSSSGKTASTAAKPEQVLAAFQQLLSKYRFMESGLAQRRATLSQKLPEIEKSLELVETFILQQGEEADDESEEEKYFNTHFEINDTMYAEAKIPRAPSHVNLWLGANVMVQYELEEAQKLLKEKKETAKSSISSLDHDLAVLKEQITTMEVNIARVYNFNVELQKANKQ